MCRRKYLNTNVNKTERKKNYKNKRNFFHFLWKIMIDSWSSSTDIKSNHYYDVGFLFASKSKGMERMESIWWTEFNNWVHIWWRKLCSHVHSSWWCFCSFAKTKQKYQRNCLNMLFRLVQLNNGMNDTSFVTDQLTTTTKTNRFYIKCLAEAPPWVHSTEYK